MLVVADVAGLLAHKDSLQQQAAELASRTSAVREDTASLEAQVVEAFVAQHYLNVPVPPSLVVSEPVSTVLLVAADRAQTLVLHQPF